MPKLKRVTDKSRGKHFVSLEEKRHNPASISTQLYEIYSQNDGLLQAYTEELDKLVIDHVISQKLSKNEKKDLIKRLKKITPINVSNQENISFLNENLSPNGISQFKKILAHRPSFEDSESKLDHPNFLIQAPEFSLGAITVLGKTDPVTSKHPSNQDRFQYGSLDAAFEYLSEEGRNVALEQFFVSMQNYLGTAEHEGNFLAETSGTTLTLNIRCGNKIYTAYTGDSRSALRVVNEKSVREHELTTVSHSADDKAEQARIRGMGGEVKFDDVGNTGYRIYKDGKPHSNYTRSLGDTGLDNCGVSHIPTILTCELVESADEEKASSGVQVKTGVDQVITVKPGDKILLDICSDGRPLQLNTAKIIEQHHQHLVKKTDETEDAYNARYAATLVQTLAEESMNGEFSSTDNNSGVISVIELGNKKSSFSAILDGHGVNGDTVVHLACEKLNECLNKAIVFQACKEQINRYKNSNSPFLIEIGNQLEEKFRVLLGNIRYTPDCEVLIKTCKEMRDFEIEHRGLSVVPDGTPKKPDILTPITKETTRLEKYRDSSATFRAIHDVMCQQQKHAACLLVEGDRKDAAVTLDCIHMQCVQISEPYFKPITEEEGKPGKGKFKNLRPFERKEVEVRSKNIRKYINENMTNPRNKEFLWGVLDALSFVVIIGLIYRLSEGKTFFSGRTQRAKQAEAAQDLMVKSANSYVADKDVSKPSTAPAAAA